MTQKLQKFQNYWNFDNKEFCMNKSKITCKCGLN